MPKINRIDVSALEDKEGTEVVSIIETEGCMQFAIALNVTDTTPDLWGLTLAALLRDMAKVMADRGVHQRGVDLSADDVARMMVSTMMGELAVNTWDSSTVVKGGGTD